MVYPSRFVVYLVRRHPHDNDVVYALKTLRDEYFADAGARERFRRQASEWVKLELRHPYIVRAHFLEEFSGRPYIGMEYVKPNNEGLNSLGIYMQKRPPDLAQSLRWAIQVCFGMEYAYAKGLRCHRHLAPSSIMITEDRTAKITDFCLAGVPETGTSEREEA